MYGPDSSGSRRVSSSVNRKLRRDLSEDFAEPYDDEDEPVGRRRTGVRVRFRGLPATKAGRIFAGVAILLLLGAGIATYLMARSYVLHDDRFVIQSSSSLEFEGNTHVTRAQLLGIFGEDVERNIFTVSLVDRRAELERLPWVAHATVMRLLPNRMRVSIVERTPVAFVRQGSHIGLVDANGVLLDMPVNTKPDAHYSFPVVTGISANDPLSTRAARMKMFARFTSELDGSGEKISEKLSEVDLSNPEDVKALIPDRTSDILVHFGDQDFLDRYRRFQQYLPEWRAVYPKLSSVDMRYERQVVLEMPPGPGAPEASSSTPAPESAARSKTAGATAAVASSGDDKQGNKPAGKSDVKAAGRPLVNAPAAAGAKESPAAKATAKPATKSVTQAPVHVIAQSEVSFAVPAKNSAPKAKAHVPVAKHPPIVVNPASANTQYHPPQVVHP